MRVVVALFTVMLCASSAQAQTADSVRGARDGAEAARQEVTAGYGLLAALLAPVTVASFTVLSNEGVEGMPPFLILAPIGTGVLIARAGRRSRPPARELERLSRESALYEAEYLKQ